MTPAQIKKAEQLLAKKDQLLHLIDRHGSFKGRLGPMRHLPGPSEALPCLCLDTGGTFTIETLELWIKQAKKAHKMGII